MEAINAPLIALPSGDVCCTWKWQIHFKTYCGLVAVSAHISTPAIVKTGMVSAFNSDSTFILAVTTEGSVSKLSMMTNYFRYSEAIMKISHQSVYEEYYV